MEGQEQEQEQRLGDIRTTDLIVDDSTDFNYLDQKEFIRMVERNMKEEIEKRDWRAENEKQSQPWSRPDSYGDLLLAFATCCNCGANRNAMSTTIAIGIILPTGELCHVDLKKTRHPSVPLQCLD